MRRLPVVQEAEAGAEGGLAARRPASHWVFIGAGFTATLWAPFAVLLVDVGSLALVLGFAGAALASGVLVGRLSLRARPVHGGAGGLLAAAVVVLVVFVGGGPIGGSPSAPRVLAVTLALAIPAGLAGAIGAALGRRMRRGVAPGGKAH